jgi:hypothetical protein
MFIEPGKPFQNGRLECMRRRATRLLDSAASIGSDPHSVTRDPHEGLDQRAPANGPCFVIPLRVIIRYCQTE